MDARRLKPWTILLNAMSLVGGGCRTVKAKTDLSTVENDIRGHLPTGSSKADVIAYLDQRNIPHSWFQKGAVSHDGRVLIPNNHTERGTIRDVRSDGFIFKRLVSIQIDFKFDDSDSKLVSYSVREVYKGP